MTTLRKVASSASTAMAPWPAAPYLRAMTDLHAVASRILERMVRDHPDEAAVLVSLVLSEILSVGLFGDDEAGTSAFADAVNTKLDEIALRHSSATSWKLTRSERARRH
jgi:hypothetical protein